MTPEIMPQFVREWFDAVDEQEYENRDNERWASQDNEKALGEFAESEEQGCCGSYNEEITAPDGSKWLVGFNYGH